MLSELKDPLAERGITLTWDDAVPSLLAKQAFGGKRGARDLRGAVRRQAEDRIASLIVDRHDELLSAIHLAAENETVTVR